MAQTVSSPKFDRGVLGQFVLVLQGGGALGAYQAGVYQALSEAGIEPDWVIGTSIGAINASLIAGNPPDLRLRRLEEFWRRVTRPPLAQLVAAAPLLGPWTANMMTIAGGLTNFFEPNLMAFLGPVSLGSERSGYYSTEPLERTLGELVDVALLNKGQPRLTVGAAKVQTGDMHYFDSRECELTIKHVMASGALPPAFPAVRVDDDLYWDGGILSNTPVEAIFDDNPRRSGLIFAVHMWAPNGLERRFWRVKKIFNTQVARLVTSRVRNSCTSCATSSANLQKSCRPKSRGHKRFGSLLRMAASRACMSSACWRRRWPARTTPRTSTSAAAASSIDGGQDTPIRVVCWRKRRGPATSILWRDSFCTKRRPAR
jgi:predicted acylesterase/phospholipase RssA